MDVSIHKVFLVGLPGCGKSTLGKDIAAKLDFVFIDLDDVIEELAGAKIPAIFTKFGEARFREIERNALEDVIARKGQHVVATGGGAPAFFDNMELMNRKGLTVYINVPVDELVRRIQKDTNIRPLMASNEEEQIREKLQTLNSAREKFYKMAQKEIGPDDETIGLL